MFKNWNDAALLTLVVLVAATQTGNLKTNKQKNGERAFYYSSFSLGKINNTTAV